MILYNHELNWESWGEVFQNIEFFRPLIEEIFRKEGLGIVKEISNLTPGTNAVFKVNNKDNNYVVKIFVPDKVKPWSEDDFSKEKESINRAVSIGINTPRIIVDGSIVDKYIWNYLILEYVNAKEIKQIKDKLTDDNKILIAKEVKRFVDVFNIEPIKKHYDRHIIERVIRGHRWDGAKKNVRKELEYFLDSLDLNGSVYVHGDLTAENVMVDDKMNVYVIDFADSVVAPYYYEYPPIVFDLFHYDKVMISSFFGAKNNEEIIEDIFKGVLLHDFGGDIVNILLRMFENKSLENINSLEEIKDIIRKIII